MPPCIAVTSAFRDRNHEFEATERFRKCHDLDVDKTVRDRCFSDHVFLDVLPMTATRMSLLRPSLSMRLRFE